MSDPATNDTNNGREPGQHDDERPACCEILIAPFTVCGDPVDTGDDLCAHHRVRMLWDVCRSMNVDLLRKAEQLTAVSAMAQEWAALCPEGDWGSGGIENAMIADCGRAIIRKLAEATS